MLAGYSEDALGDHLATVAGLGADLHPFPSAWTSMGPLLKMVAGP